MAIRKDLDDMLNSLMDGGGSSGSSPARSHNTPRAARKSKFDDMSVDDLLHALEEEKHQTDEAPVINDDTPPAVWEFAPPSQDAPEPVHEAEPEEEVTNIISEVMHTEASAEMTRVFDTVPMNEELPKPVKKKKIVITGELPDYEALRREEMERDRQAKIAAENAAEEQRAAERARRAAEAAAERARLAEEAEQRRLAREEAERARIAEEEERQRRIAEAAEKARLEEEAERQRRIAQIEAEKQRKAEEIALQARLAEEAEQRRLAEEAEKQRQLEEMRRLAQEAEVKAAAPVSLAEEIIVNSSSAVNDEVDTAIEALGEAAEAPAEAIEEAAPEAEKTSKIGGFFKKLKNKGKDEAKSASETEEAPEDGLFEEDDSALSATELIDAAIAAINGSEDEEDDNSGNAVNNMLDNIREDAAEAIADIDTPKAAEKYVLTDEDIINGLTPDLKERFDALPADKQRQVIDMRRSQLGAVAPEPVFTEAEEAVDEYEEAVNEAVRTDDLFETEETAEETAQESDIAEEAPAPKEADEKPKVKEPSTFAKILDEDPAELIAQRREHTESSVSAPASEPQSRKRLYTVLGAVLTVFAVIGIITSIAKGIGFAKSFTSGEVKKDSFTQMIYPAAIMDIEPFSEPSQLTSEQIITATIWSIIMDDSKVSKYDLTLDTVSIPSVDVEKYAVELFGENIPAFEHATVGPVESRFYYSDGAYNVKVKTITHTYAPEIKSIVKNGNEYTLKVDYIAELPQWMDKTVAKQAEYKLLEKDDGTFQYSAMKILSVNNGNL